MVALVWQIIAVGGGAAELSLVAGASAVGMLLMTLVGFVGGLMSGLYYPAYSALLPRVLPEDQLLAANGFEGMARPVFAQAGGPALASALIAISSPGAALAVAALTGLVAAGCILKVPELPLRGEQQVTARHSAVALLVDARDGFAYMVHTPWLLGTLVYASLLILLIMGPFEVLVPFVVKDQAGGGPAQHALILAAFGIGGAVGSMIVASLRMPRRYLTAMNLLWGIGCLPVVVFGLTDQVWILAVAAFAVGAAFNGGAVIWGTLLQRRVPPAMLGRVSSLDFFTSLAFMPLSIAFAGPAGEWLGLPMVFLIAGIAPLVIGVIALLTARMTRDELSHPLDAGKDPAGDTVAEVTGTPRNPQL